MGSHPTEYDNGLRTDGTMEKLSRLEPVFDRPRDLEHRLTPRLVNESIACLREDVVADEGLLVAGIIFGTGFAPFHGRPLHYVHEYGSEAIQKRLHGLEYKYGKHFHADDGWAIVG